VGIHLLLLFSCCCFLWNCTAQDKNVSTTSREIQAPNDTAVTNPQQEFRSQPVGKSGLFQSVLFRSKQYFACIVNPKQYRIEAYNKRSSGIGTYDFSTLATLKKDELVFLVNGGMFHQDGTPVGLFVAENVEHNKINLGQGKGNFYEPAPNGVFMVLNDDTPLILTSEDYNKGRYKPRIATQSGPMLVINGALNTGFKKRSTNLSIRNGVGTDKKGNVVFIISEEPVNFYELAELFRDKFECSDALYLDGFVSAYYAPELNMSPSSKYSLAVFLTVSKKVSK